MFAVQKNAWQTELDPDVLELRVVKSCCAGVTLLMRHYCVLAKLSFLVCCDCVWYYTVCDIILLLLLAATHRRDANVRFGKY